MEAGAAVASLAFKLQNCRLYNNNFTQMNIDLIKIMPGRRMTKQKLDKDKQKMAITLLMGNRQENN